MQRSDFTIKDSGKMCFIGTPNWGEYLFKDNVIELWESRIKKTSINKANDDVYFSSKKEAEEAISKYLKGKEVKVSEVNWLKRGNQIQGMVDGRPFAVNSDHTNYEQILEALRKKKYDGFEDLLSPGRKIEKYFEGGVKVEGGVVTYNGAVLHNVVVDRIFEFIEQNLPYKPLVKFLDKLMQNPSKRAVDELYPWLENKGLVINDEGNILGYKGVDTEYNSITTGKGGKVYYGNFGKEVSVPRNTVDDNWGVACSQGLHVGSWDYASTFGPVTILVEVNPKDVVSVPNDDAHKMRTCALTPLHVVKQRFETALAKKEGGVYRDYK